MTKIPVHAMNTLTARPGHSAHDVAVHEELDLRRVLVPAAAHEQYAHDVAERLRGQGFRVEVDAADDPLGKRVRNGKVAKIKVGYKKGDLIKMVPLFDQLDRFSRTGE